VSEGWIFRTTVPSTAKMINDGTLCRNTEDTRWMLAVVAQDKPSTTQELYLLAFTGQSEPVVQVGMERSPNESGSYTYYR
jgi:hypothetical protein